ncbi:MAG: hypothetical protein JST85_19615 [Acidobacteria bacterium]|nr:hypothetical protein [Acidobacteriota bacterium]
MKKQITTIVATLSLFVAMTVVGIAGLGTSLKAKIPFNFNVAGKALPAGNYIVMNGAVRGTLIIRSVEKGNAVTTIVQNTDGKGDNKASLTFRRYGNQYFFASVTDGDKTSEALVTKAERAAARENHLAMETAKPEIVTIAATIGQ